MLLTLTKKAFSISGLFLVSWMTDLIEGFLRGCPFPMSCKPSICKIWYPEIIF